MKIRKHKDKTFAIRFKFPGEPRGFTTYLLGHDIASVLKGFLFGRDLAAIKILATREYVKPL